MPDPLICDKCGFVVYAATPGDQCMRNLNPHGPTVECWGTLQSVPSDNREGVPHER